MTFYKIVRGIALFIFKIFYPLEIIGDRELNNYKNVVICANHWSNWDPLFLSLAFKRPIHWLAKIELFKNPILGRFLSALGVIPIDRDGNDIKAMKNAMRVLKNGNILGIFIEGTRVKEVNFNNAKAGAIVIGVKTKSPLLPVYIESNYKIFGRTRIIIGSEFYINYGEDKKISGEEYEEYSRKLLERIYTLDEK